MTKAEIIREIAKSTGVETAQVTAVVERFMATVKDAVAAKDNVYLRGFGTFEYSLTAEKKARDIGRGETITIPPHGRVRFRPSKDFKDSFAPPA